ncbi:MAG: hypothetical protein Ct9H300mP25_14510 [Acidobacteriota bacterium]|nr:MAG: hypothetical protein Ct9H300mP25_14510 [Acidobacteriota bacterium]
MEIFNAPTREHSVVRRERTNTPLQALVTMNDPQFVEASRYLAQQAMRDAGDEFQDRLNFITTRLLARHFSADERASHGIRMIGCWCRMSPIAVVQIVSSIPGSRRRIQRCLLRVGGVDDASESINEFG